MWGFIVLIQARCLLCHLSNYIYLYTCIVRDYIPPELCSLSIFCVVGFVVFLLFCAELSIVVAVCLRVCYLFVRSIHWDCFERKREKKKNKTIGFSKINKCTKCHTDKRRNVVTPYKMHWKEEMKQKTWLCLHQLMNRQMYQNTKLCLLAIKIFLYCYRWISSFSAHISNACDLSLRIVWSF